MKARRVTAGIRARLEELEGSELDERSSELQVVLCYEITKSFPSEERYGLTSQIRRAGVSVPSNIAEGHSRFHTKEFLNHLSIARGSLAELETELMIAQRVGFLSEEQLTKVLAMTDEIGRMTARLRQSLEAKLV